MRSCAARWLTVVLALGALGGCKEESPPVAAANLVDEGRGWYEAYCADCHGAGGQGDGPRASELPRQPTDLTRIAERNGGLYIPGAVAEYIDGRRLVETHGPREMPVWGRRLDDRNAHLTEETRLTGSTIAAIVEYIRTLQQRPAL
jgi:mono/diheme cytochrome c family protein